MTFDQIVAELQDQLNLRSPEAVTRLGRAINRRYKHVTSGIGIRVSRQSIAVNGFTTIGSANVEFTSLNKIERILDMRTGSVRLLKEITLDELRDRPSPVNDRPSSYAIEKMGPESVTIRLDAVAQTVYQLKADGLASATTLSGSMVPQFPEDFHDIIVMGVLADEYRKAEKTTQYRDAENMFERRLSDLRMFIAKSGYLDIRQGQLTATRNMPTSGTGSGSSSSSSGSSTAYYIDVTEHDVVGDGTTDDTAALQAIFDDAPEGAVVFFPAGTYLVSSTITITKNITIFGVGGFTTTNQPFGNAAWSADAEEGSVIITAMTSGAVLSFTEDYTLRNVRDILIKGLGNNTRTTIGIQGGTPGVTNWGNSNWSGVWCCNLGTGFAISGANANDNLFQLLHARGCGVGFKYGAHTSDNCNQNTTTQIVADMCNTGISLYHAVKNVWVGGLIANVQASGWGIDFTFGEENTFHDFYCENPVYTGDAIRNPVSTGDYNQFLGFHVTAMDVQIGSNGSTYRVGKYSTGAVTISGTQCRLEGNHTGTLSITGDYSAWHYIGADGDTWQFGSDKQGGLDVTGGSPLSIGMTTTDGTIFRMAARDDIANLYGRLYIKRAAGSNVEIVNVDSSDHISVGPASGTNRLDLRSSAAITVNRGISFPNVQVAESNVNTLDDYEEGTFTPYITGASGQSGQAYAATTSGTYQKVGNQCHLSGRITFTTLGTFTGQLILSGQPFIAGGGVNEVGGVTFIYWSDLTNQMRSMHAFLVGGGSGGMILVGVDTSDLHRALVQGDLSNTSDLFFTGSYRTLA